MAEESTEEAGSAPPQGEAESALLARRAMLRKAAVGAAAVGAVWTAPRVEGLSIIPDASAATGPGGTFTGGPIKATFHWVSGPVADDYWAGSPAPFFGWNNAVATRTTPLTPVGPGPAGGSVTVQFASGAKADSGGNIPVTISFPGVPSLTRLCDATYKSSVRGTPGPTYGGNFGSISNFGAPAISPAQPHPAATSIAFTIPSGTNDVGSLPHATIGPAAQWSDITFDFKFC